jgi:hypothetical protein
MYRSPNEVNTCFCEVIPTEISRGHLIELWDSTPDLTNITMDAHSKFTLREYSINGEFTYDSLSGSILLQASLNGFGDCLLPFMEPTN